MIHAVFVTHGPVGDALIEAVRGIIGIDEGLHALSVTNMSVEEIYQRLSALVNAPEEKQDGIIILACLKGGSCWNVSAAIAQKHENVKVISGVNLPMALSFVTKRDDFGLEELAVEIEKDGKEGVLPYKNS